MKQSQKLLEENLRRFFVLIDHVSTCNRKMIMSLFCKVEMSPKITISKGDCDEARRSFKGDKQRIEKVKSD